VVIIDNYDSFTYNLAHAVGVLAEVAQVRVFRNDAVSPGELARSDMTHMIVSPGPCTPAQAGNSNDIIAYWAGKVPILGVCLGHQCIAAVFGAEIVRAKQCMHGKTSLIKHDGKGIFQGLSNPLRAMRYHSLVVREDGLDNDFVVSARSEDGEVMAIRSEKRLIEGLQFHPESFATKEGPMLLDNFLRQNQVESGEFSAELSLDSNR